MAYQYTQDSQNPLDSQETQDTLATHDSAVCTPSTSTKDKDPPLIHAEWMLLVNFYKDNDDWIRGTQRQRTPIADQTRMWEELAEACSAVGPIRRCPAKLRKCWADLKVRHHFT